MVRPLARFVASFVALTAAFADLSAQDTYRQPPDPIARILDAELTPLVSVSPDRSTLLLLERHAMTPIAQLSAPEARLAGLRINPRTNAGSRNVTYKGLQLLGVSGARQARRIQLPSGAHVGNVNWSPDGSRISFTLTGDSALTLWLADSRTGAARQLTSTRVNGALGAPCVWVDSSRQVCRMVPATRGAASAGFSVPRGPIVQQSMGRAAANRTYQDLLQNSADEAQFDYLATSQLALVSIDGSVTSIGAPGIYATVDPSPDGKYLGISAVQRPYSYIVPLGDFPSTVSIWDLAGNVVKVVAQRPLRDDVGTSFDAVPRGVRSVSWRADAPATLVWAEALDDGDPAKPATKRDRVLTLSSPFSGTPMTLLDVDSRFSGLRWVRDDLALVDEYWNRTRRTRTWAVNPQQPSAAPRLVFDRSAEDRYNNPGSFVIVNGGPFGKRVVLTSRDGRYAYLQGTGASPEGDRPFLDRINLADGTTQRLWRSAAPYYEDVVAVLDDAGTRIVTRRESLKEVPNYFVRDVGSNRLTQLTRFTDPAPEFAAIEPQLITYKRADGVQLSGKLYLPPGYTPARGRLPFVFWAYPEEFRSAAAAAQVVGSPFRFVRPTGPSHLFLLTQGYGVLDGPTMPIIGEGDREPNDTYIQQLVASAQAAVDKVVEMGVADRHRIGVGGHSYGAFMTANLLAHSDLFRAGIARSGAYNRTLTPFGFQAEERTFWQARDTYGAMSPFYHADKINEPILLIHGEADNNSGTFPIQSERMYAALMGNRATVRYVVLPAESHGYAARESVGHTLWEMVSWMDTYVKNARPPVAAGNDR